MLAPCSILPRLRNNRGRNRKYNRLVFILGANTADSISSSPARAQRVDLRIEERLRPGDPACYRAASVTISAIPSEALMDSGKEAE
jgi:hypothetical protein